jgi:hypothetical protein
MWQYVAVGLIVLAAVAMVVYRLYQKATGKGACACDSCTRKSPSCPAAKTGGSPEMERQEEKHL